MPKDRVKTATEQLDALLAEVDAEVLLAGTLGAIAASRGIVPPFTRLLMAFNSSLSIPDIENIAASIVVSPLSGVGGIWGGIAAMVSGQTDDGQPVSFDRYALAASGAMEAMLMMALVKNPGTMELFGKAIEKLPGIPLTV